MTGWQFWIDRGGTFTDVVARRPDGTITTHKVLSEDPDRSEDAAVAGIRVALGIGPDEPFPPDGIEAIRMGTTVATNALLTRRGEPTALVTTRGFADALRIGHQARPDLFALDIVLPEVLSATVVEIDERVRADGTVERPLDLEAARRALAAVRADGIDSVAIVLVHGWRHHTHERALADLAADLGFGQISVSHEVSPLLRFVPRGDTTLVDAYLSPVLDRYVRQVRDRLAAGRSGEVSGGEEEVPLSFMQSSGGLAAAEAFRGKDALLSGPAGGVVGMVATAAAAGHYRVVGFDMGGTSTDVSHYAGSLERTQESEIAGVRVRAPMMEIHTIASGGGSIVDHADGRLRVGPASAGADPGPAAYGRGGPMTVTDANVVLGRVRPDRFPRLFGPTGDRPLDAAASLAVAEHLAATMSETSGRPVDAVDVAEGSLAIAVEAMANAIKKISVERGHDVSDHALVAFGGAGGQHACAVAERLGMTTVLVHPHAGVLSALGIGVADLRAVRDEAVEEPLEGLDLSDRLADLGARVRAELVAQGVTEDRVALEPRVAVRYAGSDTSLHVDAGDATAVAERFARAHRARFGFDADLELVVTSIQVEAVGRTVDLAELGLGGGRPQPSDAVPTGDAVLAVESVHLGSAWVPTPFLDRDRLAVGDSIDGPAVVVERTGTTVVPQGWRAELMVTGDLVVRAVPDSGVHPEAAAEGATPVEEVRLEIFNNLFMNVAEQMGAVLQNTAVSVNIKERLDFSCAIFDPDGELVANAPHMPVHLGSMSASIKSVLRHREGRSDERGMRPGDAYVLNDPYDGGTHLPDITVIMPVFGTDPDPDGSAAPQFFVASRGHHADVGGTVPGSSPADSRSVEEEGVLLDDVLLVRDGRFRREEIRRHLTEVAHPARNPDQNLADLTAQLAACAKGAEELGAVVDRYGLDTVHRYMGAVRANAARAVRRLLTELDGGSATVENDDGSRVSVTVTIEPDAGEGASAVIDFTGTSGVHPGNFNAPRAVTQAAVLYVLRCLVAEPIPLNAGCLEPVEVIVPSPSMLDPEPPAAVIAGNVETSQLVVDALFTALGAMAGSQGTMNNVIWGNARLQYYETLCGGAGATPRADGCSAVHTNMTNSRLTDAEVLEWRFPVVVEEFSVRHGSGGRGRHHGGDGVVRRLRFDETVTLNLLTSRRVVAPRGMAGGDDGALGENLVLRADGTTERLHGVASTTLSPGDRLEIRTPGGGGWGRLADPVSRRRASPVSSHSS